MGGRGGGGGPWAQSWGTMYKHNVGSVTCFACRISDTTGWVVGRAVQVRDVTNENFTVIAGEVKTDIHCFSPISCLTSAILSRPCSMSLYVEREQEKEEEKGSGRNGS